MRGAVISPSSAPCSCCGFGKCISLALGLSFLIYTMGEFRELGLEKFLSFVSILTTGSSSQMGRVLMPYLDAAEKCI